MLQGEDYYVARGRLLCYKVKITMLQGKDSYICGGSGGGVGCHQCRFIGFSHHVLIIPAICPLPGGQRCSAPTNLDVFHLSSSTSLSPPSIDVIYNIQ
jgi:hypothetical protein